MVGVVASEMANSIKGNGKFDHFGLDHDCKPVITKLQKYQYNHQL